MKAIELGIGIAEVKFGMTREEVEQILGQPNDKEQELYGEDEEAMLESWHYDDKDLSLGFDEDEDWRLITIAVSDDSYTLKGKSVIGLSLEKMIDTLNSVGIDELELEEDEEISVLYADDQSMKVWLEDKVVTEIQWGPLFKDEDTIDWPA